MNIYLRDFISIHGAKLFSPLEKKNQVSFTVDDYFFLVLFVLFVWFVFFVVVVFLQTGVRTLNHGTGLSSTLIIQNQFDLYKQIITFNIFNVRFLGYFLFFQAIFYNFALYVFLKCGKSVLLHELMDIKRVLSVWTDIVSSR